MDVEDYLFIILMINLATLYICGAAAMIISRSLDRIERMLGKEKTPWEL